MKLLVRWGALAVAIWAVAAWLPGITVSGGFSSYLKVALLFGLVNTFIGSLLKILTFPAVLLSLGLFSFVINAAMLMLTDKWSDSLAVKSFWWAALGSFLISLISSIINNAFKPKEQF
jgi:putative membrane protein